MTVVNSVGNTLAGQSGTGNFVGANTPTLITPNLGTPVSGNLSNCLLLPAATGISGVLLGDNGGTGLAGTGIITAPAVSTASTLAVGTAYQNTLGFDIVITVYLAVSAATSASILLGIGPTSTPTQQTIVSSLTLAALGVIPVAIYIPNNYYALLSTSGTITQTISGQIAMPV